MDEMKQPKNLASFADHIIVWGPHVFPLDPPACERWCNVVHPQNLGYTKITQGQVPRKFDLHTVQKVGV